MGFYHPSRPFFAEHGALTTEGLRRVIEAKDRCRAGTSVPGHALFLEDIAYPDALFCLD